MASLSMWDSRGGAEATRCPATVLAMTGRNRPFLQSSDRTTIVMFLLDVCPTWTRGVA
jgi:hypothetical protein